VAGKGVPVVPQGLKFVYDEFLGKGTFIARGSYIYIVRLVGYSKS